MIYLLDLNQTLVDSVRGAPKMRPFELHIEYEKYRKELVEILRSKYVILITARPDRYRELTLSHIAAQTGWLPQEAYFSTMKTYPHVNKENLLVGKVFKKHGRDASIYFGVESNPKTRSMYARYGISSMPYDEFLSLRGEF